ncbi:flavin reductase family protein [Enteractinococcus helveticum]|uniref:Flavin reductase like domain-containing protein n=1 Tax=Enteractinococcus helveticum TaxID=1837282 RepID=A0A1B7M1M0_9MICC|nr:flavin reductase family protein [Enteractinococcus helveticum]OAV62439.1 hypothetical protein A6F49_06955 [Enteractinococcus helveticum]
MTIISDRNHSNVLEEGTLRDIRAELPAVVSIVTTADNQGTPYGATVSSMVSLSLEPPLLLVCLESNSDTLAALEVGGGFVVNVASEEQQKTAFAFSKKGPEKFETTNWVLNSSGLPKLVDSAIVFDCVVTSLIQEGDHTIVVGHISNLEQSNEPRPLIYRHRKMHTSPTA